MRVIKQTYQINTSLEQAWKALTDPAYIDAWGGGPAKMDEKVGSKFELWEGDIHGTNKEVAQLPTGSKKLVQDWYSGNWPKPSQVTFTLTGIGNNKTRVDLLHENVPEKEVDDIDDGWKSYYMGPLKEFLEKKL